MRRAGLTLLMTSLAVAVPGDEVLDWTELMIAAIRSEDTGPTLSTRNLALLHTAMYDAVNSIERTHQPYQFYLDPPADSSAAAAAVGAAYEVIKSLYPSLGGRADDLYGAYGGGTNPPAALTRSLAFGASIGQLTLQSRDADGSATQVPYIPRDDPGQWRRTPPFFRPPLDPQWGDVTPFCLSDIEPFMPPGPPPLTSAQYAGDFNQVKDLGAKDSPTRTAEQSQIAVFWSDFSYTATPPGHWHEMAMVIARNQHNTLAQNARLFTLLSLAQADAAIVCWEAKYRYNSWRPITAIQRADEDGNPATQADTTWVSLLNAPSFPEYTSGHSSFSRASATILTRFYGTDALSFTVSADALPGVYRSFTSLAACADEIGMSRIYGGIHFMSANRDGQACGAKIADFIAQNYLLSNAQLPRLSVAGVSGGQWQLRLQGHFGRTCVLDASSNLRDWQPVSTNAPVIGGLTISDPAPRDSRPRFFRVREY